MTQKQKYAIYAYKHAVNSCFCQLEPISKASLAGSATFASRPVIRIALFLKAMNIHWHMTELYMHVCGGCSEPNNTKISHLISSLLISSLLS